MKSKKLNTAIQPTSFTVEKSDWAKIPKSTLIWMLQQMLIIRAFEEKLLALKDDGLVNGPVHTSVGQEAVAVGAALAVRDTDKFSGTHRAHHQYLAKALTSSASRDYNPLKEGISKKMQDHVLILLKEIMGLAEGCSGGRGGSMHLFNSEIGIIGTNAIVGGGVPPATGVAWADRMLDNDSVTMCFFGDGAVYQGVVHESCNLASLWDAKIIYAIENNHYAVATSRSSGCSAPHLAQIAAAYGMPGFHVDGNDPVAVMLAIQKILASEKNIPCVLEIETYRHYHHAGNIPGSAFGYRSKDEEAEARKRDPMTWFEDHLRERKIRKADIEKLHKQAHDCIEGAAKKVLKKNSDGSLSIRDKLWPTAESAHQHIRDEKLKDIGPFVEAKDLKCKLEMKYSDAIASATGRWLEQDPGVVIMGEEVANMGGGAYGATKGLVEIYPERVRNTPITEAGFTGLACGAAMNGMHPIIELMFSSFGLVAADQLFNQVGQLMHIYNGNVTMPLVCRTRVAAGLGYGAQHSADPVSLFALFPGWRIVAPTTPFDYIGLFNAAMKLKSPTLIVEHHGFYSDKGMVPENDLDYVVEIGKAVVRREGTDATVAAYGWGVRLAELAAEQLAEEGISVEVIDLRTLDDATMDYETIGQSICKTGALVTVEEAQSCNALGSKIIRACEQRWFDYLDAPAACVNALDVPLPVSRRMELLCLPDVERTTEVIRKAANRK